MDRISFLEYTLFLDHHLVIKGIKGSKGFQTKILCSSNQMDLAIQRLQSEHYNSMSSHWLHNNIITIYYCTYANYLSYFVIWTISISGDINVD